MDSKATGIDWGLVFIPEGGLLGDNLNETSLSLYNCQIEGHLFVGYGRAGEFDIEDTTISGEIDTTEVSAARVGREWKSLIAHFARLMCVWVLNRLGTGVEKEFRRWIAQMETAKPRCRGVCMCDYGGRTMGLQGARLRVAHAEDLAAGVDEGLCFRDCDEGLFARGCLLRRHWKRKISPVKQCWLSKVMSFSRCCVHIRTHGITLVLDHCLTYPCGCEI